jgi:hypothetical protein
MIKLIKKSAGKIFHLLCKFFLPKRYYDPIFISEFIKDAKSSGNLDFKKKYWSFRHGFLPHEYSRYNLSVNDYRGYIPARNSFQKRTINGTFNSILANKIIFERHIKSVLEGIDNIHVVESIGFIEEGYLKSLKPDITTGDFMSLKTFLNKAEIILKPTIGDGGVGLFHLKKENDSYSLNSKKLDWEEVLSELKKLKHYLIQERLRQKGFSSNINPDAVNSMRIATMIDPISQQPFIAYGVHRFGSVHSGFLDNINQGGIGSVINIEDGILTNALYFSPDGQIESYDEHPLSSKPIAGEKIPGWDSVKDRIIQMAGRMPYLKYVGWDIILSDDQLFIMEGNVSPGLNVLQVFFPMKDLIQTWSFFKYYNYID